MWDENSSWLTWFEWNTFFTLISQGFLMKESVTIKTKVRGSCCETLFCKSDVESPAHSIFWKAFKFFCTFAFISSPALYRRPNVSMWVYFKDSILHSSTKFWLFMSATSRNSSRIPILSFKIRVRPAIIYIIFVQNSTVLKINLH